MEDTESNTVEEEKIEATKPIATPEKEEIEEAIVEPEKGMKLNKSNKNNKSNKDKNNKLLLWKRK